MIGKTVAAVHNEQEMQAQRSLALAHDECILAGMEAYAQIFLGLSLYLYDSVGTPGYLSLFLLIPYQILTLLWARALAQRGEGNRGVLSMAGRAGEKCLAFLLFLSALLDVVIVFFGLCAMIRTVMPDLPPWTAPGAVILFTALSLLRPGDHALSRLARLLRWIIGGMLFFCGMAAVPYGQITHFYPLLGNGPASIGRGAVWMSGAASAAVAPILTANEENRLTPLLQRKAAFFRPLLLPVLFGAWTMGISVWLMPYPALIRPQTLGWRMLLITNMTPSVAVWSLEFLALVLLLMLALCAGMTRASVLLSRMGGNQKKPASLPPVLTFLLAPFAMLPADDLQRALILFAPFRGAATLLALAVLSLALLVKECGKNRNGEAMP